MGSLDADAGLQVLRRANLQLCRFFEQFSGAAVFGSGEEVEAMLQVEHTLKSVGALIDAGLQHSAELELREEFLRYRQNLLRLRLELAAMQHSATACRERLQSRQNHLQGAKAWCAASRASG